MSPENCGTILLPCLTGSTCESVFQETTPLNSGSTCALKSAALGRPAESTLVSSATTCSVAANNAAPANDAKERFIASIPVEYVVLTGARRLELPRPQQGHEYTPSSAD